MHNTTHCNEKMYIRLQKMWFVYTIILLPSDSERNHFLLLCSWLILNQFRTHFKAGPVVAPPGVCVSQAKILHAFRIQQRRKKHMQFEHFLPPTAPPGKVAQQSVRLVRRRVYLFTNIKSMCHLSPSPRSGDHVIEAVVFFYCCLC